MRYIEAMTLHWVYSVPPEVVFKNIKQVRKNIQNSEYHKKELEKYLRKQNWNSTS